MSNRNPIAASSPAPQYDLLFDVAIVPRPRTLVVGGPVIVCLAGVGAAARLVWLDSSTGRELRRTDKMGPFDRVISASDGHSLAIHTTGTIGSGSSRLLFFSPEGRPLAEYQLPGVASSGVQHADGRWYVGCRNSCLYTFTSNGEPCWTWEMPDTRASVATPNNIRPCPYLLAAGSEIVATSSFTRLYVLGADGRPAWNVALPPSTRDAAGRTRDFRTAPQLREACRVLELTPPLTPDTVKTAFRLRARETHPDTNPGDPTAATRFMAVQSAYRSALTILKSGTPSSSEPPSFSRLATIEPDICDVAIRADSVVVGTYGGHVYRFDCSGHLSEVLELGRSVAAVTLTASGNVGTVWCDEMLWIFSRGNAVSAMPYPGRSPTVGYLDDGATVVWGGLEERLKFLTPTGATHGELVLPSPVRDVTVSNGRIFVLGKTVFAMG
jgi:DnaJ domain